MRFVWSAQKYTFLANYETKRKEFGRAAALGAFRAALASGYPLHHPLCASRTGGGKPRPYGWFRYYPSRKIGL
jgi:hypothetical protein